MILAAAERLTEPVQAFQATESSVIKTTLYTVTCWTAVIKMKTLV